MHMVLFNFVLLYYIYIYVFVDVDFMLWHRQTLFASKGDTLSSSTDCKIRTQGLRHQIASSLNARRQNDWTIEDQAKNLNSSARPYGQRAFNPPDPTASWLSHLALAIYMFVVVNSDTLAQANVIRFERRQVVLICWRSTSHKICVWFCLALFCCS